MLRNDDPQADTARTSSSDVSNHSHDNEDQPHGDAYGALGNIAPSNNNDLAPLVTSQSSTVDSSALSGLLIPDLLITLVLVVFIAVTIKLYQVKGNLTGSQKHAFNTLITGLIVILGLSCFVSSPINALSGTEVSVDK